MATPSLQPVPQPTEFSCPNCLAYNRLIPDLDQQRCAACHEYHNTIVLYEDGWAL